MPLIPDDEPARNVARLLQRRHFSGWSGQATTATVRIDHSTPPLRVPLGAAIDARKSTRSFSGEPITRTDLGAVLTMADDARRRQWPTETHGDPRLTVLVLAQAVDGLPAGIHVARSDSFDQLVDERPLAALWHTYADAPALLLICGDLTLACAPGGVGYGALLFHAGAFGYAAWLAALSLRLACCVYGGANGDVTAVARRFDLGLRHLFTVSLGRAVTMPDRLRSDGQR